MKLLTTIATIAIILTPAQVNAQSVPDLIRLMGDVTEAICPEGEDKVACNFRGQIEAIEALTSNDSEHEFGLIIHTVEENPIVTPEPADATLDECLAVIDTIKASKGDKKVYTQMCQSNEGNRTHTLNYIQGKGK